MALSASEWNAIKWYMNERDWTMRDMMDGPFVRFRNQKDEIEKVNISHIKEKYKARPRGKTRKVES